ncbi:hypothetical protein EUX98_g6627 [Antrodiella citrinella]|uniref:Uncharacterized protein n=1 Tax=Antrodiella citrinella TaxID=2447956 RepID=A0A4S4MNP0_9APHY|nr:hypothetical protein EUX98_g6627 [Antrodiella citrinella]
MLDVFWKTTAENPDSSIIVICWALMPPIRAAIFKAATYHGPDFGRGIDDEQLTRYHDKRLNLSFNGTAPKLLPA